MNERLAKWKKKLTKENMAVAALLGLLLMVIAIPAGGREKKAEPDEGAAFSEASGKNAAASSPEAGAEPEYAGLLEERLEELLSSMEGNASFLWTAGGGKGYSAGDGADGGNGQRRRDQTDEKRKEGGEHGICYGRGRKPHALCHGNHPAPGGGRDRGCPRRRRRPDPEKHNRSDRGII